MNDYKLSPDALVMVSGSSKGTQDKYYNNGYWYKVNSKGYEGTSEYLVSKILECSNVDNFVSYEKCTINNRRGCRSKNFLQPNESFISFQRLYEIYHGGNLSEAIIPLNTAGERINFVKNFIKDTVNIDVSDYLSKTLTLDMLTLNTDRHFNNLGLIINAETGECKEAPIFDNGAALLSNFAQFEPDCSIDENIEKAHAMPFSLGFELQTKECGIGLAINYTKLEKLLSNEPQSRALDVLKHQIERYKAIIPEISEEKDINTQYLQSDVDINFKKKGGHSR